MASSLHSGIPNSQLCETKANHTHSKQNVNVNSAERNMEIQFWEFIWYEMPGIDVKIQCIETISIKYQINSFFKMVTEAYVPLKLDTYTAHYWQFTHETGNLFRER